MRNLIGAVLLSAFCATSYAGTIGDRLAEKLTSMNNNEQTECMIVMQEQFDVSAFKQTMTMANSTRQERHAYVINSLQEMATRTQSGVLAYLDNAAQNRQVGKYRSYWISNCIYAQLSKTAILDIAGRAEVEGVYFWQEPELIKPVSDYPADDQPVLAGVERGLEVIHAPEVWAMGYTGAGRLVASIDTGVDGNHPALNSRWRGNNGAPPEESWLDTTNPSNQFPYDSDSHGTHTMGTMTGLGVSTGDTIGVAFGAQWIAARAIVSGGNASLAFQWLADPDGDPNTIDDVPDVISNSWGYHDFSCPQYQWNLIDNCEAAGIVVVFAAGNRQSGDPYAESMWAPASRNTTDYNTFSVGAVNGASDNFPIADFSARGPSQCDHSTIKPEVVAPGVNVRSSVPGGGYQQNGWSGTSMACPHVAGTIALLRQYNPNASVDTIKWALMQSATDLGQGGEDNTYGHGIINALGALNLLPANEVPNLYIYGSVIHEPNDNYPDPGEDIELILTLANSGVDAMNIFAIISTEDTYAEVTQDSAFYGDIAMGEQQNNEAQPFEISFDESTPIGRQILFSIDIHGDGYSASANLTIRVGRLDEPETADFDIGNVDYTISNFGIYGLNPPDFYPEWNGQGFKTPHGTTNYLFEGALLIGDGPTRVSNGARDDAEVIATDFVPLTAIDRAEPGEFADQEYACAFNDENAMEPLEITVDQTSYAWADAPDNVYIITKYDITNSGDTDLNGVMVAHFEDWDMPWAAPSDRANFDRTRNLGYQYYSNFYRGLMVLNSEGASSFRALHNDGEVYPPAFTLADKWNYMNSGFTDTAITTPEDASIMLATGPFNIPFGATVTASFAIVGANNLSALQAVADAVIEKYDQLTSINDNFGQALPESFGISSTYPNPFNPSTSIRFAVDKAGPVELTIYNIMGQKVQSLIDEQRLPGTYEVTWNGRDGQGGEVASGMYFVRLRSDDRTSSKKMLLLR